MNQALTSRLARRISLRQLQVFEAVARQLSFTRAAEELYLTQPTVSMQIKKLENDIGLPLTEQVGKTLSLTGAGQALYRVARDMLDSLARFEMQIDDMRGLHTGQLRIAVVSTAKYFAPRMLGAFCRQYPGINVSLEVTNRVHILDRMNQNLDDLYLIGKPPQSNDLDFQPYLPNPMVVVAPVDHRLAGHSRIPLREIAGEPFILREQGSGTRIAVESVFAEAGLECNVRIELGSNEAIKQGISGGLGISVLSLHTLTGGDMQELTILDVEGFPISWQWYVGYPKGKRLSVVANTFIDFLFAEGPSMIPQRFRDSML